MRERFTRVIGLLLVVAVAGAAPAAPAKKKSSLAATPKLTVPAINYKHRTLPNGLEVYSIQDRSTPTVAINVWYRVGSKHDPQRRSGFAHLFEHIMFKSTKNMPSEMMDRLTEDVGGFNNATTYEDSTKYYEVVPSNYLETLLWAEAERMGSLTVDDANFKSERDVVKEEFRYRVLSPPYGRLFYTIARESFEKHPYNRPGIGSIEDLDAATVADVRDFHAAYYRPDNAVLIVAGDFEQKQLDTWIDKYLSVIAKPSRAIPAIDPTEPVRKEEKRVTERVPNVPLPAVAIVWTGPSAAHADAPALTVAEAILSGGESSRLYQSLVYKQQLAVEANAYADLREDLGLFGALVILASGKDVAEGEKAVRAELKTLQDKGVTAAELEKAKNQIITAALQERETNEGKANALGEAIILERDATAVNKSVARLQAVTAADVQRVVRKYAGAKPVVINYVAAPEAAQGGNQ